MMFESREIELKGSVKEGLGDYQKYIPIYQQFIDDNTSLADKTLNYNVTLKSIEKNEDSSYNEFVGTTENNEKIPIFTKFCPLFDPTIHDLLLFISFNILCIAFASI